MILLKKFGFVVLAVLFVSAPFFSLKAEEKQCLDDAFSATGKPSKIGELARANAFFTWKAAVKEKHGKEYNAWSAATERKLLCIDLMSGENKGKWECTRTARPCKSKKPVIATKGSCKDEISTAWGKRRGSIAAARLEAQSGWKLVVEGAFGAEWTDWSLAKEANLKCVRKTKYAYQCIATGKACHS